MLTSLVKAHFPLMCSHRKHAPSHSQRLPGGTLVIRMTLIAIRCTELLTLLRSLVKVHLTLSKKQIISGGAPQRLHLHYTIGNRSVN